KMAAGLHRRFAKPCMGAANACGRQNQRRPRHPPPSSTNVKDYSLAHLSDQTLLQGLSQLVTQDRTTTASMLAHIAEVDARKLYLSAGYPSMFAYCVEKLRLSEDSASKRIRVARHARDYPQIFAMIADGRLHLSGVALLSAHLSAQQSDELLEAAA